MCERLIMLSRFCAVLRPALWLIDIHTLPLQEFKTKHGKDISGDARSMWRLWAACERAKRTLSASSRTSVEVEALVEDIDYNCSITRTQFEHLNQDLFGRCIEVVERALQVRVLVPDHRRKPYVDWRTVTAHRKAGQRKLRSEQQKHPFFGATYERS